MKKVLVLFAVVSFFALSCGSNEATKNLEAQEDAQITKKEINSEVVKTVANLNIEGMMCEKGCGGKIQQELRALAGVADTKLEFDADSDDNVVSVEYNPTEVSEQELIKCVNAISDGKYHVKSVEILTYKGLTSSSSTGGGGSINSGFGKIFYLFDLFQSVSNLTEF